MSPRDEVPSGHQLHDEELRIAVPDQPWMNAALAPEQRAALVLAEMTRDEKLVLINGHSGQLWPGRPVPPDGSVGPAGFVPGVARLGIPAQQETDASLGVSNLHDGIGATALPSGLALAASWDEALVEAGGQMIGAEARAKGFNVMLAGGCNLTREPRCGRNFEYLGEDPLLAGILVGASIRGIQSNHIVSTIKHFALNAQETGRTIVSAEMDEAAMRESDLLAFEIGIEKGDPGAVMTAYNRINQVYAGEHDFLLNGVLKRDWGFTGYTMSDWGGCHSTEAAALGGLDQESGQELDIEPFFQKLGAAIDEGRVPAARLDDMAKRILVTLFRHGVVDHPAKPGGAIDRETNLDVSQRAAEAGIVLLKNDGILPLERPRSIAVIGAHADVGVLSGGGSTSVVPWGGFAREVEILPPDNPWSAWVRKRYHPSSPLEAIRAVAQGAEVRYDSGADPDTAAKLASECDVVVLFAEQWTAEGFDTSSLGLWPGEDALIAAVAKANPNCVVVLQTGGAVTMPWLDAVPAVLAAWYPGARGAEAIAAILFGRADPAGRLPITFPKDLADTPNPELPGAGLPPTAFGSTANQFDAHYPEGADAGYRWYARKGTGTLFPFGFGLTYTKFAYTDISVAGGDTLTVSFSVTNSGDRAGTEVAQVYLTEAAGERVLRLIGWAKLSLQPGETRAVSVTADPRLLGRYDVTASGWQIAAGDYAVAAGKSAEQLPLQGRAAINSRLLPP
jgi:beta-glucosidase